MDESPLKQPSLMNRSQPSTFFDRLMSEPKLMLGAVGAVGAVAVLLWTIFPSMSPNDVTVGGEGETLFASREAANSGARTRRKRRTRKLSILSNEAEVPLEDTEAPVLASAMPGTASASAGAARPKGSLQTLSLGEPGTGGVQAAPEQGPDGGPAPGEAFRAPGSLEGGAFGKQSSFGATGSGGGGGGAAAGGPGAALGRGAMRVGAMGGGRSGVAPALAGSGVRPVTGASAYGGGGGLTGQGLGNAGGQAGGAALNGGPVRAGGAPAVGQAKDAAAGGGGPAAAAGGHGGGAGGAADHEAQCEGPDCEPEPQIPQAAPAKMAKAADIEAGRQAFLTVASALEDVAKASAMAVSGMTLAYSGATAGAVPDVQAFGGRVEGDRGELVDYPDIVDSLQDVNRALNDPADGIVTRLNANKTRLNNSTLCLRSLSTSANAFTSNVTGPAASCHSLAQDSLSQRTRDYNKIQNLRTASGRWADSAIAFLTPLCYPPTPSPAPSPTPTPTPEQIKHCNALQRVTDSKGIEVGKLGDAMTKLDVDWNIGSQTSAPFSGSIMTGRNRVRDEIRRLETMLIPQGLQTGHMYSQLQAAVIALDAAAGGWQDAHTGNVAANKTVSQSITDARITQAAAASGKLVQAIGNLKEAARAMEIVATLAPEN
ncbi:MAG: hypothetical protein HY553_17090 [Elusimicrobia bacterium]|nr:hypothetical protein [Elusimicrobiota bacterium]